MSGFCAWVGKITDLPQGIREEYRLEYPEEGWKGPEKEILAAGPGKAREGHSPGRSRAYSGTAALLPWFGTVTSFVNPGQPSQGQRPRQSGSP